MFKVLALLGLTALSHAAFPKADLVSSLDQMPDLSFGLYSGYLPINNTQKQLHYIAAISSGDWTVDPVIIWFNGGPGCSSLLGWAQEHGPYVMQDNTTAFVKNQYAWNQEATVIYIESPAGVGYSKCPDYTECNFTDDNTADDNLIAVLNLLTMKFQDLQKNDLYLAGESYAGIYVPKLASRIDEYITNNTGKGVYLPNLKGIIVGNGVTNWKYDGTPAYVYMSYWHGLIDQDLYDNLQTCNLTYYSFLGESLSKDCQTWMDSFQTDVNLVNVYDVFGQCYATPSSHSHEEFQLYQSKFLGLQQVGDDYVTIKKFFTAQDYTPFLYNNRKNSKRLGEIPPCVYAQPILEYLRTDSVKTALHIPADAPVWDLCANINYTQNISGSIDIYTQLKDKNYKMLKYSGDTDGAIPAYGTQSWINDLNWDISKQWYTYFVDGQVAGYAEYRNNGKFVFATIHGAGHMAPQWKRPQTYHTVFNFIRGDPI